MIGKNTTFTFNTKMLGYKNKPYMTRY